MHGCSPPSSPTNGKINEYQNKSAGASLTLHGYYMTIASDINNVMHAHKLALAWVPTPQCILAGTYTLIFLNTCMIKFFSGMDILL